MEREHVWRCNKVRSLMSLVEQEYIALRQEVLERVRILHGTLNLLAVLEAILAVILISAVSYDGNPIAWRLFLICPLLLVGLVFNYQANQMALEAAAIASDKIRRTEPGKSWDEHYGHHKTRVRLTSFLKIWPILVLPVPVIVYLFTWEFYDPVNGILVIANIAVAALVLINFRYKILSAER